MKKFILVLVIILLPSIAFATFSIQFDNTTGKKLVYLLYWIDHHYDWPHPFNLAGGELAASESVDLEMTFQKGKYYVIWSDNGDWQNKVMVDVSESIKSVVVTPIKSTQK